MKAVPWLYLVLGLAQVAHSIEEVLTGLWRWMPVVTGALHTQLNWIPVLAMSEQTFVVANLVINSPMLALSPFVFLNQAWAWKVVTAVAVVETLNGIGHLSAALVVGGYFSGCLTAIGLLLFSIPIWSRNWILRKKRSNDPR